MECLTLRPNILGIKRSLCPLCKKHIDSEENILKCEELETNDVKLGIFLRASPIYFIFASLKMTDL